MRYFDTRGMFYEGNKKFSKGDMKGARRYFDLTINNEEYRNKSLEMLAKIDLAEGKISDAREKIYNRLDNSSDTVKRLLSRVEAIEYNYNRSQEILVTTDCGNIEANFDLAFVKMHMSDVEKSRRFLESCIHYEKVGILARFYLIFLSILEGDYNRAYKDLKRINKKNLRKDLILYYNRANILIGQALKKDIRSYQCDKSTEYFRNILLGKDDDVLLSHVSYHKIDSEMLIFSDINLRRLLEELRDKMNTTNFNIYGMSANYGVMLDYPVAIYNGKEIYGMTVSTILGTDKIMTFYPTQFSEEFDTEGYSKNPELKKRFK